MEGSNGVENPISEERTISLKTTRSPKPKIKLRNTHEDTNSSGKDSNGNVYTNYDYYNNEYNNTKLELDGILKKPPEIQVPPTPAEEPLKEELATDPARNDYLETHDNEKHVSEPQREELEAEPGTEEIFPLFEEHAFIEEVEYYNIRALPQNAKTYELEKFPKNTLLIFNHKDIVGKSERLGTELDVAALKDTFGKLNFEVDDKDDLTKEEIMKKLKECE
jgi:hypothetical protein